MPQLNKSLYNIFIYVNFEPSVTLAADCDFCFKVFNF